MDLARAPRRAPLTARKKGSGYENGPGIETLLRLKYPRPQGLSAARGLHRPWDTRNRKCKKFINFVVTKAHAPQLGRFRTRNNFHSEILRTMKVFVLTYVDRIILASENCSTSAKYLFSEKPIRSLPLVV